MTDSIAWLEQRLSAGGAPLIIDGGMGTQLERLGAAMDERVWSARAVLTDPEVVQKAHVAFIDSGAEVIITNTFAAGRHMLEPGGLGDRVEEINRQAVRLAQQARDQAATGPLAIAGSICEWTYDDDPKWSRASAVRQSVKQQATLLAEAGVDLIALEMCERIDLSVAAVEAVGELELPLWIGVSARTHPGYDRLSVFDFATLEFKDLVQSIAGYPAMCLNVMHTPVTDVDEALGLVRDYWKGPVGVYPEAGYFEMPNWKFVDIIEPADLVAQARGWIDRDVRLLGGCCGLGPEHITALREAFA